MSSKSIHFPGGLVATGSGNSKIGRVATSYCSRKTCSKQDCPFRGPGDTYLKSDPFGCYGDGICGRNPTVNKLVNDPESLRLPALTINRLHAEAIERAHEIARDGTNFRLDTIGDVPPRGVPRMRRALESWIKGKVWLYTHWWRRVPRAAWGALSVLASIERADDGPRALAAGYAPSRVVTEFHGKSWVENGVKWVACPAQIRVKNRRGQKITCKRCRLCWHADKLVKTGRGVALIVHGTHARKAIETIKRVNAIPAEVWARKYETK